MTANKLITIAIDGNEANTANRVGSNVYAYQILVALAGLVSQRSDVACRILLSQPPLADMPPASATWQYQVVSPPKFWTQWAAPLYLFQHKTELDVFFTPGHYAPRFCPIPSVTSVMDLAFLNFPKQFLLTDYLQLKYWTAYSVKNASKVIAISQATKDSVITTYRKPSKDVVIAYPALTPFPSKSQLIPLHKLRKKYDIKGPYILYVGTLQPRKNLPDLIAAYERAYRFWAAQNLRKQGPLQLVLAGKQGWLANDILARVASSPQKRHIILTGFVNELEKWSLLANAKITAQLGTQEGFGIPALESMAVKVPVVAANASSLPEVVGKAGILVPPKDIPAIAIGLKEALTMGNKEKRQLQHLMRSQVEKFSWQNSAQVILNTLLKVASQRKQA